MSLGQAYRGNLATEFRERLKAKAKRLASSALASGISPEAAALAAEQVEGYMELQSGIIAEELAVLSAARKQLPMACKKGCAYCCHTRVETSAPEVVRLVAWIRANLSTDEQAALRARLKTHRKLVEGWHGAGEARKPTPCPMLVDDVCSVHPARPLTCRAFNSVDVRACILAKENWREPAQIPAVAKQVHAASAIIQGLAEAFADQGYADASLELPTALSIAMEDATVSDRWVADEDVFAPAREL